MLRYSRFFLLITLAATLFHACDKSEFYSGKGVSFNASSKSIATKVSYGDDDETLDGIRAINWKGGDKIRIYCPQTTEEQCDYVVDDNKVTTSGIESIAKGVSPVGDALKWSEGEHHFYCVYPSPSVENAVTKPFDVENNSWIGTIPAVQKYPAGGKYSDLSQYMMLVGYAECAEPQPAVDVDFYPVTTCLEFEMTNNNEECDLIIKSISLSSSSQPLSGNFKVTYDDSQPEGEDRFVTGVPGIPTSNEYAVKVNFGEDGQAFNIGSKLSFKMFLNPAEDIINPTLTINAKRKDDGVSVVLSTTLTKKNNVDLKILKKHITPLKGILVEGGILFTSFGEPELVQWGDDVEDNITVSDEYEYQLEVVGDHALNFDDSGKGLTKTLQVKSYKQAKDGTKTPVKPSVGDLKNTFISSYLISDPSDDYTYTISFTAKENTETKTESGSSLAVSIKNNTTSEDVVNLSENGTSNCYVVNAPGTYKFKIAYGNGVGYGNDYKGTPSGKSVDVLWRTSTTLFTSGPNISGENITFTVSKDDIQQGNALIALYSGENKTGNIVWSWHIWFTDEKDISTVPLGFYSTGTCDVTFSKERNSSVVIKNSYDPFDTAKASITMTQGGKYKDVSNKKISTSACTYYQWGRKDPFRYKTNDIEQYRESKQISCDINDLVQNPERFYLYAFEQTNLGVDCYHYHDQYYWSPSTKTVFDPSPVGMRVKKLEATDDYSSLVTGCYKIGNNSDVYGRYDYIIQSGGPLMFWSSESIYTTSDKVNAKCASTEEFYSSTDSPITSKANAYCVMCVSEKSTK